jgi:alkaline phosphatase D
MAKKRIKTKFEKNQIENMVSVGMVGPTFARIWIRSDSRCKAKVIVYPQGKPNLKTEHDVTIDDKVRDWTQTALIGDLSPLTRYKYKVVKLSDNTIVGSGQFETFPGKEEDTPKKFSIALMSCHQPFNQDNFQLEERRMRLLDVTKKVLSDHDAKFILLAGDQIYSDVPYERSLFYRHYTEKWNNSAGPCITDWDMQSVREAYHERYRIFWHMKQVKHIYANYPCIPILDDHEIVDDWGAVDAHSTAQYLNVKNGAREAYFDYQGSRVLDRKKKIPPSFHYSFEYGSVGVFVFDLRSQRKAGKKWQLFNPSQLRDFEKYLNNNQDKRVLLIMVSVPVVHLPEWLADVGAGIAGNKIDFPDHWSYEKNRPDRDRFLKLIYSIR